MSRLLATLATASTRRVLFIAGVVFLVAAAFGAPVTGMLGSNSQDFQDPASQYERANDAIRATTGQSPYFNLNVLLHGARPVSGDVAEQRAVATVATLLASQKGFQRAVDYPGTRSTTLLSRDGRQTAVLAAFDSTTDATRAASRVRGALVARAHSAQLAGMRSSPRN